MRFVYDCFYIVTISRLSHLAEPLPLFEFVTANANESDFMLTPMGDDFFQPMKELSIGLSFITFTWLCDERCRFRCGNSAMTAYCLLASRRNLVVGAEKEESRKAAFVVQTCSKKIMAPQVGLEPTTLRLTAECSAS